MGGIGGGSGGSGGGASLEFVAGGEKEVAPLRRDTIRSIFFTAPCHVTGESVLVYMYIYQCVVHCAFNLLVL